MPLLYALCRSCDTAVAGPTPNQAYLDGAATLHAKVTGHALEVLSDDDDEPLYRIAGEPGLFSS